LGIVIALRIFLPDSLLINGLVILKVNNNDFSRAEDELIRQSIREGLDAEVIARMLKNKHNKAQIKQV